MTEIAIDHVTDMSKRWRLVSVDARDDEHRVDGTLWVSEDYIKAVDLTVWISGFSYGRSYHDGEIVAPTDIERPDQLMIRQTSKSAEAEDARDLLTAVFARAAHCIDWQAIRKETTDV